MANQGVGNQNQQNQAPALPHRLAHVSPGNIVNPTPNIIPDGGIQTNHDSNRCFALFWKDLTHGDVNGALGFVAPNQAFLQNEIEYYYALDGLEPPVYGRLNQAGTGLAVDVYINGVEYRPTSMDRNVTLRKVPNNPTFNLNWGYAIEGNALFVVNRTIHVWVQVNSAHKIMFFIETR